MREVRVHVAWVHLAVCPNEVEQRAHLPSARRAPWHRSAARVHQRLQRAGHEAIVHEDVLVHVESAIEPFEIAGAITDHPVAERQILGARRRTDRIGLYEGQSVESALKCGRREEAAPNSESAQLLESHAWSATWRC